MGSILGGGKSSSSSGAINSSASEVARVAQAGGQTSSNAIRDASQTSAQGILLGSQISGDAQREALEYLRMADLQPRTLREGALGTLGANYGIGSSGSIMDRAMANPMYKQAIQQGENAVLRNASATGGLRSGTTSENLAQVNQNALIASYNDQIAGLQGLAALPSNANNIAAYSAGVGNAYGQGQVSSAQTLAQGQISAADALANANNAAATAMSQGQIAAAQNKAQGSQNSANNMMGMAGLGMQAFSQFSDRRLKSNIEFIGEDNGIRKYKWVWNKIAEALGLNGPGTGVMADEVETSHPGAVSIRDGFKFVDYQKLGVSHGI